MIISEVGGVNSVNKAFPLKLAEEFKSVYKINVFISACDRIVIRSFDDRITCSGILVAASEGGGARDHNDWELGIFFANDLEEWLVRCVKERRGCVEIVIINEHRHIKCCYVLSHSRFASRETAKAEVSVVHIKSA